MPELRNPDPTPVMEMTNAAIGSMHAPDLTVIQDINWSVHAGQYWVIGGVPASGKSDLMVTGAGLMRPTAGSVRFFGQELVHVSEEERLRTQMRLGIVFGNGGRFFNRLTVGENLALPLCYHHNCDSNASEERVLAMLKRLELTDWASRTPSPAQRTVRQRVALGRALILSPELLFFDNPLMGLDPRESRWWLEFLESLRRDDSATGRGPLTLVVGTDDLQPWCDRATHFAVIADGRFIKVGGRAELANASIPALRELLPVDWLEV